MHNDLVGIPRAGGGSVGGDQVKAGDINGSSVAIGRGAMSINVEIVQSLKGIRDRVPVGKSEQRKQVAEDRLAEAILHLNEQYVKLADNETIAGRIKGRSNPYRPSMNEYRPEDAPFFFGRDAAIERMMGLIYDNELSVLVSDFGLGRASFIQAGLASRLLAEGAFPLYIRLSNRSPTATIKEKLLADYDTQDDLTPFRKMGLRAFLLTVSEMLGERDLIIFLDGFEEFFDNLSEEDQEKFTEQLDECIRDPRLRRRVSWVLGIDREYLPDLNRLEKHAAPPRYFLEPFTYQEAFAVITKPATMVDVTIENDLAELILDDIINDDSYGHGDPIKIPPFQVQLVGYKLFDALQDEKDPKHLSKDLYDRLGCVEGILVDLMSDTLKHDLDPGQRKVAWLVLKELTTSKGERREVLRREMLSSPVTRSDGAEDVVNQVLETLKARNLVHEERDDDGESVLMLTHDSLLRAIPEEEDTDTFLTRLGHILGSL